MPATTDFAIALHFHQPLGNFDEIFERAYNRCYLKFLNLLRRYPEIKMSLHFSGSLLSWIEENHPEFFNIVIKLIEAGQIEIISGGFYEPILPVVREEDAIGQIKMLTNYIKENFKFKSIGAWIPERVWEPQLVPTLKEAGIKYAIVDDAHFIKAGLDKSSIYGYYMAEYNSEKIALFGSDKNLRYFIPFKKPKQTIDYFRRVTRNNPKALFFYGDDAEKFGEWPGTYRLVYENRWLENFFKALIDNSSWLKTVTLKQALAKRSPLGRIYVPSASYDEMLKWSGGCWRNFLTKYPESNQMHKKMMLVSKRISGLRQKASEEKMKKLLDLATEHLYKAESNCGYWHGLFGGLYLFNLRAAIYENLIKAEVLCRHCEERSDEAISNIQIIDYNCDNYKEIIFSNRLISAYFSPRKGGTLLELDYKPLSVNLINTLSRKKEAYHKGIKKKKFIYDSYQKYSFLDHIIPKESTYRQFKAGNLKERLDFINRNYSYKVKNSKDGRIIILKALSDKVSIEKKIALHKKGANIRADYSVKNISASALDISFGIEFNIIMPDGNPPRDLESYPRVKSASNLNIKSKTGGINLDFHIKPKSRIWICPINTISRSEKGYKYIYQGTSMLFSWPLKLLPGNEKIVSVGINLLENCSNRHIS